MLDALLPPSVRESSDCKFLFIFSLKKKENVIIQDIIKKK